MQTQYLVVTMHIDQMLFNTESLEHNGIRRPLSRIHIEIGIESVEWGQCFDDVDEAFLYTVFRAR